MNKETYIIICEVCNEEFLSYNKRAVICDDCFDNELEEDCFNDDRDDCWDSEYDEAVQAAQDRQDYLNSPEGIEASYKD